MNHFGVGNMLYESRRLKLDEEGFAAGWIQDNLG